MIVIFRGQNFRSQTNFYCDRKINFSEIINSRNFHHLHKGAIYINSENRDHLEPNGLIFQFPTLLPFANHLAELKSEPSVCVKKRTTGRVGV